MTVSLDRHCWAKGLQATLSNANPSFSSPHPCPTSWELNFHLNRGSKHSEEFSLEWVIFRDYTGCLNPERTFHLKGQDLQRIKWRKEYKNALLSTDFIWRKNECTCSVWASLLCKSCWDPKVLIAQVFHLEEAYNGSQLFSPFRWPTEPWFDISHT